MSWENRKRQRGLCTSDQAYLGVNTIPPVVPVRRCHLIRFYPCFFEQYDIIIPGMGKFLFVSWSYPQGGEDTSLNDVSQFACSESVLLDILGI